MRVKTHSPTKTSISLFPSADFERRYQGVVNRLYEALSQHFLSREHLVFSPIRFIRRPFSDLVQCRAQSGSQALNFYIKFVRLKGKSKDEDERMIRNLEREVTVIRHLNGAFPVHGALAVPKLLAYFPEEKVVVTEESKGDQLLMLIAKTAKGFPGKRTLDALSSHCYIAGTWLNRFQRTAHLDFARKEQPEDLLGYVDLRLKKLLNAAQLKRGDVLSILKYIQKQLDACLEARPVLSATHGDFSLSNILAAKGRVIVLDFGMYRLASPYLDLSYFCQHMDDFLTNPLFVRSTTETLNRAFLEGYAPDFDAEHPLYRAYYVRHMVNHLVGLARVAGLSKVKRLYQNHQYRHCLSTLRKMISKG